jgi:hypothetical protein
MNTFARHGDRLASNLNLSLLRLVSLLGHPQIAKGQDLTTVFAYDGSELTEVAAVAAPGLPADLAIGKMDQEMRGRARQSLHLRTCG